MQAWSPDGGLSRDGSGLANRTDPGATAFYQTAYAQAAKVGSNVNGFAQAPQSILPNPFGQPSSFAMPNPFAQAHSAPDPPFGAQSNLQVTSLSAGTNTGTGSKAHPPGGPEHSFAPPSTPNGGPVSAFARAQHSAEVACSLSQQTRVAPARGGSGMDELRYEASSSSALHPASDPSPSPFAACQQSTASPATPTAPNGFTAVSPLRLDSNLFEFDESQRYRSINSHPLEHVPTEMFEEDEPLATVESFLTSAAGVAGSPSPYSRHSVIITAPVQPTAEPPTTGAVTERQLMLSGALQNAIEAAARYGCQAEVNGLIVAAEANMLTFTLEASSFTAAGALSELALQELHNALRPRDGSELREGWALHAQLLSSYDMLQMRRGVRGHMSHNMWPHGSNLPGPLRLGLLRVDSAHGLASAHRKASGGIGPNISLGGLSSSSMSTSSRSSMSVPDLGGPWAMLTLAVDGVCPSGLEILAIHENRNWLRVANLVYLDQEEAKITVALPLNDLLTPGTVRLIARLPSRPPQLPLYSAHLDIESSDACRAHLKERIVELAMQAEEWQTRHPEADLLRTPSQANPYADTMLSPLPAQNRPEFSVVDILGKGPSHPGLEDVYQVGEQIGRGGYATVHNGINFRTGELVAIKTLVKSKLRCKEDIQEVQNEVAILNLLAGLPHVVELKTTHEDEEAVHIVMELCAGGELLDAILQSGSLSERRAAQYFRKMLEVVNACHELGVFHRDLKLENFLLTSRGPDSDLRLADFGLGVFFKRSDRFHELVGTPYYVAPEVVREDYGSEADMWSLGVVLYTLLSGLPPFYGGTDLQIFKKILRGKPDLEGPMWIGISDAAKDMIRRLLRRDPAQRITAAAALHHPWLEQQGASDDPLDSVVLQRLRKFAQMNKLKKMFMMVVGLNLSQDEIEGLRELFKSMDTDSNGTITVTELSNALANWGHKIDEARLRDIMAMADVDGDGLINYNEFVAATMHESKLDKEDLLLRSFRQLDRDKSGKISASEVSQAFSDFGMMPGEAEALIETADSNHDGQIDYNEYCSLMREPSLPSPRKHVVPDADMATLLFGLPRP